MLLLTAVFALWLGVKTDRARKQREAVVALRNRGYLVWYDYHFPNGFDEGAGPPVPRWLRRTFNDDWFSDAVFVSGGSVVRESDLLLMQHLPQLKELFLHRSSVCDSHLARLSNKTSLEKLHLGYTAISDDGLEHLRGLSNLRELFVNETHVTKYGVQKLQQDLPECKIVN